MPQWEQALRALQEKYAKISLRVAKTKGVRPFFVRASPETIPLRCLPLTSQTDVLEECRHVMKNSFRSGDEPPLRVTLLLGSDNAIVILSAHHAFFDGIGLMNLIRDTLSFLGQHEEFSAQAPSPSVDTLAGFILSSDYESNVEGEANTKPLGADISVAGTPPKLSRIELSPQLTKAIIERAHQQGTTVNGVLMAAVLETGKALSPSWRRKDVTCVVPVNVRSMFHQEQAEGIVFGQKRFVFDLLHPAPFWETALLCSEGVKEVRTLDGLVANLRPLRAFLAVERSVPEAVALANAYPHDLMISNFGSFEGPTRFGSLRLRTITPIVDSGDANTQTVMVATTGEVMTIVLVSPTPVPNFLVNIQDHLAKVCALTTA